MQLLRVSDVPPANGWFRLAAHVAVVGGAFVLAACSESTARFEEPTSFRFNDRNTASGGPSGYWNGAESEPVSYADDYEYRGGRDPATGSAPSHLPPSAGSEYGDGHQAYGGDDRRHGGGQRTGAAQAGDYGNGRQAYAVGQDDDGRRSGGPASGGYDNSPSPPSSVGMTSLPPTQN